MKFPTLLISSLILFNPLNQNVFCSSGTDAIDSVKVFLVEQRYNSADQIVKKLLIENPGNTEALYLGCAIWQMEILDYESYNIETKRFLTYADSTLSRLARALPLQKGKDSIDCLFYMASILGGIGVVKAKNGNWPGAIKKAFASAKYFKHIVNKDTTYYPGYYGIGVFNYYLSKQLKWLPFFGDNRLEAIQQLRTATRAVFPYNYAACNSLCWIYIERGQFDQADSMASSVLTNYPDNTLFLRIKVRIDLSHRHWNSALSRACRLIELSSQRSPKNWSDLVTGYQALICSYDNLAKGEEALQATNSVLSLPIPDQVREISFVKKHLNYIEGIRKKYAGQPSMPIVNTPSSSENRAAWHSADCQGF
jgi:tetratricopeptide (TPR) repeat protein